MVQRRGFLAEHARRVLKKRRPTEGLVAGCGATSSDGHADRSKHAPEEETHTTPPASKPLKARQTAAVQCLDFGLKASFLMASKVFPTSSKRSFFTKEINGAPST